MKKLLCRIFGHITDNKRRYRFRGSDVSLSTWTTHCKNCGCGLFHAKGMVKNQPDYITTIKL